jgi:hypothetical protein
MAGLHSIFSKFAMLIRVSYRNTRSNIPLRGQPLLPLVNVYLLTVDPQFACLCALTSFL